MDYHFECLYSQALLNFPEKIEVGVRLDVDYVNKRGRLTGLMAIQDRVDDIFRLEDVPSLLSHLTHVIIGCIHKLLIQLDEVYVSKLNIEYVKSRFHELLTVHAFPLLNEGKEPDGCFDLNEINLYITANKL